MIITNSEVLNIKCETISSLDDGIKLCEQISDELTKSEQPGIGLAANQIGVNKRACIIRTPEIDPQGFKYNIEIWFVNPRIEKLESPVIFGQEGCLSFPNQCVRTLRYAKCRVVDDLEPRGWDLFGMRAIVAQHEIDHTLGKTMYNSEFEKLRPKQPCPCGSGQSFKLCCKPKAVDMFGK